MLEFVKGAIANNLDSVAVIAIWLVWGIITSSKTKIISEVKNLLIKAVSDSKTKVLNSREEMEEKIFEQVKKRVPKKYLVLISDDKIKKWIQNIMDEVFDFLDDGKFNDSNTR
ncbi:hypothetical protein D3C75_1043970 [compost metagenome]